MKILMVNKFYYIKGGSETYFFALKRKLEEEGHQVIVFSMKDEKNFASPYDNHFVGHVEYDGQQSILSKVKMAVNIIYSEEAKQKFEQLVINEKPDIVHLHLFQHQISPSILDICKKYDLPTVYTAHDLKMICPNYKMMHHGKVCEECRDGHYYHCAFNKCIKDSYAKSLICMAEGYFHKFRKSYDAVDFVITPSAFYKQVFAGFHVDPDKVIHIPNFLDKEIGRTDVTTDSKKYLLYFGRLSEEKGIITLIRAMSEIPFELYIVGTGPLEAEIRTLITDRKLNNIRLFGFRSGQELTTIVANAKAVILPSEWYENCPYSAIEALQLKRPILASDIGGIPELIDHNGALFEPGSEASIISAIYTLLGYDEQGYAELEQNSLRVFHSRYSWNSHKTLLMKVYESAIDAHKNR